MSLNRSQRVAVVLLLLFGLACLSALQMGSVNLSIARTVRLLWHAFQGSVPEDQTAVLQILWDIRLPRMLMAICVGALLATSGVVYQAVLRNPLAEPFILGVSSGAGFFAILGRGLFSGSNYSGLPALLFAFIGGVVTILLVFALAGVKRGRDETHLLLVGIMLNFFMAAMMMLTLFAMQPNNVPEFLYLWMGSLSGVWTWEIIALAIMLILSSIYFLLHSRTLNALSLGELWAQSIGFDAAKMRFQLLLVASVTVAATVAFVGMIGFIGLLVPHLLRLVLPAQSGRLVLLSALTGATFLLFADSAARQLQVVQIELPVGVISALLGCPLFLYILIKQLNKRRQAG